MSQVCLHPPDAFRCFALTGTLALIPEQFKWKRALSRSRWLITWSFPCRRLGVWRRRSGEFDITCPSIRRIFKLHSPQNSIQSKYNSCLYTSQKRHCCREVDWKHNRSIELYHTYFHIPKRAETNITNRQTQLSSKINTLKMSANEGRQSPSNEQSTGPQQNEAPSSGKGVNQGGSNQDASKKDLEVSLHSHFRSDFCTNMNSLYWNSRFIPILSFLSPHSLKLFKPYQTVQDKHIIKH